MKKILLNSAISLVLGIGFVGCGKSSEGSSDFDYLIPDNSGGTSIDNALKVTPTSSGMKIEWSRTGKARYGSYTQLEVVNDIKTYRIASTNTNSKITIYCTERYKENTSTKYSCSPNNVSYSYPLYLSESSANIVQERGGVSESNKTVKIGNL